MITQADFLRCLPELFLAFSGLFMLMIGVFIKKTGRSSVHLLTKGSLLAVALLLAFCMSKQDYMGKAFGGLFIQDSFSLILKMMLAWGGLIVFLVTEKTLEHEDIRQFEYPILMIFAILGMFLMLSANDLLSLFVGLELQSLSLYVLTAMKRDHFLASEAAVKYFVLGALSTGFFLYGCSLIYGLTGVTNFDQLSQIFGGLSVMPTSGYVGFAFILMGLIFKISAVPCHMWTPDVYEGSPTGITTFLASLPKLAALGVLTRVLATPFYQLWEGWQGILSTVAIASMVWGAVAALNQKNMKRLLAYSSINTIGYVLIGLVIMTEHSVRASMIYMVLYVIMVIAAFTCLMNMSRRGYEVETIEQLKGLIKIYPGTAGCLAFLLFSMAGIPPLAGFLGKLYVIQAAMASEYYVLSIVAVITSVVAAAYYLYIIKVILMDTPDPTVSKQYGSYRRDPVMGFVLAGTVAALIWVFVVPGPFVRLTTHATSSLFPAVTGVD